MTNKNSTFETWFRELEQLAKKLGEDKFITRDSQEYWDFVFYRCGYSPQEAIAEYLNTPKTHDR